MLRWVETLGRVERRTYEANHRHDGIAGGYLGGGNPVLGLDAKPVPSANLTSDDATGIGKWSEAELSRTDERTRRFDLVRTLVQYDRMAINVHQAKTQLSKLLQRVEAGETIVIARDGVPVAELKPIRKARAARVLGRAAGKVVFRKNVNAPLPKDMLDAFER